MVTKIYIEKNGDKFAEKVFAYIPKNLEKDLKGRIYMDPEENRLYLSEEEYRIFEEELKAQFPGKIQVKFKIIDPVAVAATEKDKRKTRKLRKELKAQIEDLVKIIELNERTKGSYFWKNNGNAYARARKEEEYSFETKWDTPFVSYELEQDARFSRANAYIYKTYIINEEETNITKVRSLLEEMKALLLVLEEPKKYEAYVSKKQKKALAEKQQAAA